MPKGVEFIRSVPRWLLVRSLSGRWPGVASGALSCIRFRELEPPPLPSPEWVRIKTRLSGICGSDLSAIGCKGSPYFSPFVSTPFVPGHELVGDIVETGASVPKNWKQGTRVVIEPALGCEVRGIESKCFPCSLGYYAHCENILKGTIKGGIQTGYCASTGGGWSRATVVAHHSQLHEVPAGLSDDEAVLAEPLACSVHAALKAMPTKPSTSPESEILLVIGCGSIGLMLIFAYRAAGGRGKILAIARYKHQAELAQKLGANEVFCGRDSNQVYRWVLERTDPYGGGIHQPELGKPVLLGGADVVFDCVGSSDSIDDSMRLTRTRGKLILVGMPGIPKNVDWTSVWYKELSIQGAYAYGFEWQRDGLEVQPVAAGDQRGDRIKTMRLALEFLTKSNGALKPLVNRKYPLEDYRAALMDAFRAGKSKAFKTVLQVS